MNKQIFNLNDQNFLLDEKEVQVWIIDLDQFIVKDDLINKILSDEELLRASKFHFKKDEKRFVSSRILLRVILGHYTNNPPATINFSHNQFGKPELIDEQNFQKINFNISHSQYFLCMAFAKNSPIGIDCEVVKPIEEYLAIAERHFSPTEFNQLKSFPNEKHLEGFYTIWTAKEAIIKLIGTGLHFPLQDFSVKIQQIDNDKTYRFEAEFKDENAKASVELFHTQNNLFGAIATRDKLNEIIYLLFDEQSYSIERFIADYLNSNNNF
jgi:4'-phosphopantetheinyl transferase